MQSIFNITSVYGDYSNKKITILTNFTVDATTVNKANVKVINASSGTIVVYKLSTEDNKIIITLKEWPNLNSFYQINVTGIKDKLGRDLITPITKDIKFTADTKLKAVITNPIDNEAVLRQHNLIYFSINRINADGTITTNPNPELKDVVSLPTYNTDSKVENSEIEKAIFASESDILYEIQFASDIAFFNIIKSYSSKFTDGLTDLNDGQYYMRARVIQDAMNGDWSDIITFNAAPQPTDCNDATLTESQKDYLDDIFASADFFFKDDEEMKIVSRTENGDTCSEFYIEFNMDIDETKLPDKIIAYRSDL